MIKKFGLIMADPPWKFKIWSDKGNGKSPRYPTLDLEAIKALPVSKLADRDCLLFLWVTMPFLEHGFDVIKSWGFEYRTCGFVWAKLNADGTAKMGNGYWTRANAEICLLGGRGKPQRVDASVRQLILTRPGEHSAKPELAWKRAEKLLGDVPRCEIFARNERPGWTTIGDEIDGRDIREVLENW